MTNPGLTQGWPVGRAPNLPEAPTSSLQCVRPGAPAPPQPTPALSHALMAARLSPPEKEADWLSIRCARAGPGRLGQAGLARTNQPARGLCHLPRPHDSGSPCAAAAESLPRPRRQSGWEGGAMGWGESTALHYALPPLTPPPQLRPARRLALIRRPTDRAAAAPDPARGFAVSRGGPARPPGV